MGDIKISLLGAGSIVAYDSSYNSKRVTVPTGSLWILEAAFLIWT